MLSPNLTDVPYKRRLGPRDTRDVWALRKEMPLEDTVRTWPSPGQRGASGKAQPGSILSQTSGLQNREKIPFCGLSYLGCGTSLQQPLQMDREAKEGSVSN